MWVRRTFAAAIATLAAAAAAAPADAADRYALQGGCYDVVDGGRTVAPQVRLQATALGRYLLYTKDERFLTGPTLTPSAQPSDAADFAAVEAGGDRFTLTPKAGGASRTVAFAKADGCAVFPEAALDAEGTPSKGATPYGAVGGILEGHMHWMAYDYFGGRFRCGRPWSPFGIAYALPDCRDREGPQGTAAVVQNVLNYGSPAEPHSTANYPTFPNQSKDNLTYEGMYWRWVERVWKAGLRLMVMGVNENRVLCELQTNRSQGCNEMDTMRRGFQAIKDLQDYVDAQAGGPGKGFFQIVTDPFQAREVINQGRMAVVLEIETSEPFDCRGWENPTCDTAQIDRQLEEMNRIGVRSSLLLGKYDNPLSGVRFDSGVSGYLTNAGNKLSAGTFWSARTCQGKLADNTIDIGDNAFAPIGDTLLSTLGVPSGTLPTYPPAPHCNTRGLTDLGRYAIKRMMQLGWIVNPDHMSQAAVDETLSILEAAKYSGVISPHGWIDPGNWPRLWKLGGLAFPGHSSTDQTVEDWRTYRPEQTPYRFAWGYGADLGGLSHQPGPSAKGSITYPFTSYDGKVTFTRQKTGERTFDFTKEGVSHYGLYADWLEDVRRVGGRQLQDDLWQGAEAYLEMWERASGVPSNRCFFRRDGLRAFGRGPLRLGATWRSLLAKAGQPQQRDRAWSWCVKGKANRRAADVAVLSPAGVVQVVGSTASGRNALGVGVGSPSARAVARGARGAGPGLLTRRVGGRTYVWSVRGGRVRAVAVTSSRFARNRRALRSAVRRVVRAKADNRPRTFVPNRAQTRARLLGRTLVGTGDRRTSARLASLRRPAP